MTTIAKPHTFSSSTTISSSQVNSNFDTLYNDYNGGISAANLSSDAVTTTKIADSNVTAVKIVDGGVTPNKLVASSGSTWVWQSWTPTWTNITVGNGTVTARYTQIGKTIFFKLKFVLGSSSAVSGADPTFTLPVTSLASYAPVAFSPIGHAGYNDASAGGAITNGAVTWNSTTTAALTVFNAASTYLTENGLNTTVPFTWTTSDSIFVQGYYEAA